MLQKWDILPNIHILDNECLASVLEIITKTNAILQLVKPYNKMVNAAKRAIHTFKNHFIADLCMTKKISPLKLRDCLIEQAEDTINMIYEARSNLRLSA